MTIHVIQGYAIFTDDATDQVQDVQPVTLRLVVPDNVTSFSYRVLAAASEENPLPEVDITSNEIVLSINGLSVSGLMDGLGKDLYTYLGQITHSATPANPSGQVTQILTLETPNGSDDQGQDALFVFPLAGAPIPVLNTPADFSTLEQSVTMIGGTTVFPPNTNINFSSITRATTLTDNLVQGTSGKDTLDGTAGNDVIITGTNGDYDQVNGSAGDDIIVLSAAQDGDFYEFRYEDMSGPITVNVDIDTGTSEVVKGSSGTDTIVDLFRAVNYEIGGEGAFFVGTGGNDTFNLDAGENSWIGIAAGAGNDTYNLNGGNNVRLNFYWDGNGYATSGANVNLSTGVVSNDGFGGMDTINLAANGPRVEVQGTDLADTILGSARDERFILRGGNDTLDAGDGWDVLRYDRRDAGPIRANLEDGTVTGHWDGEGFLHRISGVEELRGSRTNDLLVGSHDDDFIRGRGGNDLVIGNGGNDQLEGDNSNAFLIGDQFYASYDADLSAQVFRLYQATLGRAPDAAGHRDWMVRLFTDEIDLSGAADGFVGSREFQNVYGALDNTAFVQLLYQNVLGRAADAGGLANWVGQLDGGTSRANVVTGFSESREFINNTTADAATYATATTASSWFDEVYRVYLATLGREADEAGFLDWVTRLSTGTELSTAVGGFVGSREFQNTYGALDNTQFVEQLYRNVLNREADASGLANWVGQLDGGADRADVVLGFSESREFISRTSEGLVNWVRGLGEDDNLNGEEGQNMLAGGMFSDVFEFNTGVQGSHRIIDLEAWDYLNFYSFGYNSVADLRAHLSQDGSDVVFNDQGVTVVLENTQLSALGDDMFWV